MAGILDQTNLTGNSGSLNLHYDTNNQKGATKFTCGLSGGVTSVHLVTAAAGSPTGNMWVEIWTDNTGVPGVKVGGTSANQSVTGWGTGATERTWTWSTNFPMITSGTNYHVVIDGDFAISSSNFITWIVNTNASFSDANRYNGSSWSAFTGNKGTFSDYSDPSMVGMVGLFGSI